MYMYKVSYGRRSWWSTPPEIDKLEVVKKTAKTVVYKEPKRLRWIDGKYEGDGDFHERRENLKSDGVKWFDTFEEAKEFALEDQRHKLESNETRVRELKENIKKLQEVEDE